MTCRSLPARAAVATAAAALLLEVACAPRIHRAETIPAPVVTEPAPSSPPPPPVSPPPPSELEVTMAAAGRADAAGDAAAALMYYERAATLPQDPESLAALHFTLALLYADPSASFRDLERARTEIGRAVALSPTGPRASQGRLVGSLIDELIALRAQSAEQKAQSESKGTEIKDLKARLDERERELAAIKKILLQEKGKP